MTPAIDQMWASPEIRRITLDVMQHDSKSKLEDMIVPTMNSAITIVLRKLY